MISINKLLFIGLIGLNLNATTLKDVINSTVKNNENIQSLDIQNQALEKSYQSVSNSFNPTLNLGANYLQLDGDTRSVQVGQTTTGFAKLSIDIYNGGKNNSIKKQKKYEYSSSLQSSSTIKKQTLLQVVTLYFQAKTVIENIQVLEEKSIALKAQYDRIKIKYDLKMTTIDEVLKFQSEYESNNYLLEELKYQKESLFNNLYLLSNIQIDTLESVSLPTIANLIYKESSAIKALEYSIQAKQEDKNIAASIHKPQIKLEDSYNIYSYDDYNNQLLSDLPDQQNQLMLTATIRLFDTSSNEKIKSANLVKLSLQRKLNYLKKQEKLDFKLAKKNLETLKLKISSLKSAVEMANSVYDMVKIKYENGVLDNITYLDALSKKVYNKALYAQSLNDYEIAKANYYFTSGVEYNKILQIWE